MNDKFVKRLTEFLDSECDDYGLNYSWEWNSDTECCEVEITRYDYKAYVEFKYNEKADDLSIEMGEDSWYETREFDYSVKYFWMMIAPEVFPTN